MGDTMDAELRTRRTHYEGCWRSKSHHACAVAKVEQLQTDLKQLRRELYDEQVRRSEWEKMYDQAAAGIGGAPDNVHLGVSVENQAAADERIPWLLQTPAAVHYVSVEPMLGPIDLQGYLGYFTSANPRLVAQGAFPSRLDWVICGGESGPGARPMHPDWVRSLRDQCQAAGVPFFFKSWGAWLPVGQWEATCQEKIAVANSGRAYRWLDGSDSLHIGKKAAGHLLDSRAWQEFPRRE